MESNSPAATRPFEPTTRADLARDDEHAFLWYVRDRDAACPLCGYNVRGLNTNRCPECGRELRLTLGLVEVNQAAWVTLVVVLCASGGFGLFCILMVLKQGWPWNDQDRLLNLTFLFHMIVPPFAVAAVLWRRRFLRLTRWAQWAVAGVVATSCALVFALFMVLVE